MHFTAAHTTLTGQAFTTARESRQRDYRCRPFRLRDERRTRSLSKGALRKMRDTEQLRMIRICIPNPLPYAGEELQPGSRKKKARPRLECRCNHGASTTGFHYEVLERHGSAPVLGFWGAGGQTGFYSLVGQIKRCDLLS
jgi:hypothetical protein